MFSRLWFATCGLVFGFSVCLYLLQGLPFRAIHHKSLRPFPYRIAFFTAAFYGAHNWPPWFPLYLKSCASNAAVASWFILTDQVPPYDLSITNVRLVQTSYEDIQRRMAERTGLNVTFNDYKLGSDYHALFADLFREYLEVSSFSHWGHTDVDVFYGDISRFLTQRMLHEYDVISGRQDSLCGPLSVYRNTHELRTLYKKSPRFKEMFSIPDNSIFDEGEMTNVVNANAFRAKWSAADLNWEMVYQFYPGVCRPLTCKPAYCNGEVFNFMFPPNVRMLIHLAGWRDLLRKAMQQLPSLAKASCWYIDETLQTLVAFDESDISIRL